MMKAVGMLFAAAHGKGKEKFAKGSKGRRGTGMERRGGRGRGIGRGTKMWGISSDG